MYTILIRGEDKSTSVQTVLDYHDLLFNLKFTFGGNHPVLTEEEVIRMAKSGKHITVCDEGTNWKVGFIKGRKGFTIKNGVVFYSGENKDGRTITASMFDEN